MEDVLRSLAKSVSIQLGVTVATSATDAAIHQKIFGSGMNTLIIPNGEVNDIMKIVLSFLKNLVCKKVLVRQFKMRQNNEKEDFLEC